MSLLNIVTSKIMTKIGILSIIQILFIIIIFGILTYVQSQQTLLGNSINIAGKNRFLTLNILYEISEYLTQSAESGASYGTNNNSQIKAAENQLESNIMTLKEGGKTSGIELEPLPPKFTNTWNTVQEKWVKLKTALHDQLYKNAEEQSHGSINKNVRQTAANTTTNNALKQEFVPMAIDLINSSDILVTDLGQGVKKYLNDVVILQTIFGVMNGLLILFILFLVGRLLKPVSLLTRATSEVKKGNLGVSISHRGKDELSVLADSFNSMILTIKSDIKKQTELADKLTQLNKQLLESDKAKDEFINIAAHEFRNPIQSIAISISLLINKIKDKEQRKLLDVANRNSRKLKTLAQNLLEISKIESKSLTLTKEKFSLNELMLDIIEDYEDSVFFNNTDLKITYYSSDEGLLVYADKNRICQVICNLIDNSIKFITNEGIISITTEKKKGNVHDNKGIEETVVVTVKDSGTGIDPEIMPRLFTKFTTKSFQGTGLGLYICKNIIEAHGGKIWAENNKDGKGATFSFSLPLCG
jgi:signal transduction histidine kinase